MSHDNYTVAWICALALEMASARAMLDVLHDKLSQSPTDDNTYSLGEISGHNVVITCLPAGVYGTTTAASVVTQLRSTFPAIRFGLLVGIGGGAPNNEADIRLGDVVVSKPTGTSSGVIQYNFGKTMAGGVFERTGWLNKPPDVALTAVSQLQAMYLAGEGCISSIISNAFSRNPQLKHRFSRPSSDEDQLFDARYEHLSSGRDLTCATYDRDQRVLRTLRASDEPHIHFGVIASGNQVIKDRITRDHLAHSLGVLCFEMEAAGFMNKLPALIIRGICDYSDSHKNKIWQGYAALAAAGYAKELLYVLSTSQKSELRLVSQADIHCDSGSSGLKQLHRQHQQTQIQALKKITRKTCYDSLVGRLSFEINSSNIISSSDRIVNSRVKVAKTTFLPPSWMSNTMLRVNVETCIEDFYAESVPRWTIQPVSINQNPRLLKALQICDVDELKKLFQTNKAQLTDMVFDKVSEEPVTLLETILRVFTLQIIPCSSKLFQHRLFFQFLLDQGLQPSLQSIIAFFLSVDDLWAYDQPQLRNKLVKTYLDSILAKGGLTLDLVKIPCRLFVSNGSSSFRYGMWDGENNESILSVLIEHVPGFQVAQDCLFSQSQGWTVEDLEMRSRWYIGILAHTDETFLANLIQYCSSFRSPFKTSYLAASGEMVKTIFDMRKIVDEVRLAPLRERGIFLQTVIQEGTPQMLDPFLRADIDLDEGYIMNNYLGTAVSRGKLAAATALLGAGASSARALPMLCESRRYASPHFEPTFLMLMNYLTDTKGKITKYDFPDPIVAVLECNHAMEIRPNSVELLLKSGVFHSPRLYGSQSTFEVQSYVLNAIYHNRPDSVKTLLAYGVSSESNIKDMFAPVSPGSAGNYTWLTLAIELGKTACVKALIEYSGNSRDLVTQRDWGGRCAIDFAQSLTVGPHPRFVDLHKGRWIQVKAKVAGNVEISFSEDIAIYDILRAVFDNEITEPKIRESKPIHK